MDRAAERPVREGAYPPPAPGDECPALAGERAPKGVYGIPEDDESPAAAAPAPAPPPLKISSHAPAGSEEGRMIGKRAMSDMCGRGCGCSYRYQLFRPFRPPPPSP
jgi:hypothetical protein